MSVFAITRGQFSMLDAILDAAIRTVREALMTANASIVLEPQESPAE